ncbi:hypothetical protein [Mesorhizobium sp. M0579]|uniref:hypothetical protein n=1 Tax=Mesorhizobium sp. M0579 TaxID=2956962 RepID=UPI00333DE188
MAVTSARPIPLPPVVAIDDQSRQPRRQFMRGFKFVANQQAGPDRDVPYPRHKRRLEAISVEQLAKPGDVLIQRSCAALEKGGDAQSRHCINIAFGHRSDGRLHSRLSSCGPRQTQKQNRRTLARRFQL